MAKKQSPTLKQIAELSGFSQSSVSMILNNRNDVSFSEDTVRLVLGAAEKLGYEKKSGPGRKKRSFGRDLIAVLSPNISNPYYATLVQSIEQSAREKDFLVIAMNTYRSEEAELRILEILKNSDIAGIIFTMPPRTNGSLEKGARKIPAVMIGDKGNSFNIDTVEMDNYGAGVLIAEHLLGLGHRRIAYVSTTLDQKNSVRLNRLKGIEDTFKARCPGGGVKVLSRTISPEEELSDLSIEHRVGYELAKECLADRGISAFAAVNDMVAYGAVDAVLSEGLSVPGDCSVCGFDNVFPSRLSPISLTTVDNYIVDKGHHAFNILFGRISGAGDHETEPNVITRIEYPPRLIVRSSSGKAKDAGK